MPGLQIRGKLNLQDLLGHILTIEQNFTCAHNALIHDNLVHLPKNCKFKFAGEQPGKTHEGCIKKTDECDFGHDHWPIRVERVRLYKEQIKEFSRDNRANMWPEKIITTFDSPPPDA